jgi:hypothetical protein
VGSAENRCRENAPDGLNSLRHRRVLVQREMCPLASPSAVIVFSAVAADA